MLSPHFPPRPPTPAPSLRNPFRVARPPCNRPRPCNLAAERARGVAVAGRPGPGRLDCSAHRRAGAAPIAPPPPPAPRCLNTLRVFLSARAPPVGPPRPARPRPRARSSAPAAGGSRRVWGRPMHSGPIPWRRSRRGGRMRPRPLGARSPGAGAAKRGRLAPQSPQRNLTRIKGGIKTRSDGPNRLAPETATPSRRQDRPGASATLGRGRWGLPLTSSGGSACGRRRRRGAARPAAAAAAARQRRVASRAPATPAAAGRARGGMYQPAGNQGQAPGSAQPKFKVGRGASAAPRGGAAACRCARAPCLLGRDAQRSAPTPRRRPAPREPPGAQGARPRQLWHRVQGAAPRGRPGVRHEGDRYWEDVPPGAQRRRWGPHGQLHGAHGAGLGHAGLGA
jgi:hypothetical protein